MDKLTNAIFLAAIKLHKIGWVVDDDGAGEIPTPDCEFVKVVREYVSPLFNEKNQNIIENSENLN